MTEPVRLATVAALALMALPAAARPIGAPGGSGPYPAIAEALDDAPGHTLYRPARLPGKRLPLVLWGNGGCRDNGLAASHFLREIASHGYVVIANGRPRAESPVAERLPEPPPPGGAPPPQRATPDETSVSQMLAGIDLATRGRLARHVDGKRIAAMGHSCGGLQALAAGADRRVATVVAFNSGVYNRPGSGLSGVSIGKDDLLKLHGPVAYFIGGPGDIAHANAADDVRRLAHVPVFEGNLPVGHGGTFALANGGDWGRVAVAWLDWQLKRRAEAGRWFTGADCRLCTTFGWTITRKHFPETP